jgi:CHAT domain-containing protein
MSDKTLTLQLARDGLRLKVSLFEGVEKALRPYAIHEAAWEQIEKSSGEIFAILQRSNRTARPGPEILDGLRKAGHILFDLLIPPQAKDRLAATTATILTLHLEDTLVHLPWELLYDGREFLCRRFAIGRIVSTCQVPTSHSTRAFKAPFKILVLADPRGDLEACYREGLDIKTFLDRKREVFRVDFKSHPVDIAFVKKNIRDYDIIHYAGHAEFHPRNPCESSWLLADGKLRANEVCAMGGLQPMPLLVFSNACQSGQTDEWRSQLDQEQQIFGLANAFLLSGVRHYIGTFWEIPDEPSAYFAKAFYGFLAGGESVGMALRNARQALIRTYSEEALIWASYMLYGEPGHEFSAPAPNETPRDDRMSWRRRSRSGAPAAAAKEKLWPSLFLSSLIGALSMAFIYAGYSYFYSGASNQEVKPSVQPSVQSAQSAAAPTAAVPAPLSLTMNMIGQRKEPDGSYSEVIVKEGSVLHSGDHFQVHVETNKRAHVYVLLLDSQGQAKELFPDPKIEQAGFIEGGRRIAVPEKDLWFWLDENTGTETLYILASEKPLANVRELLRKMEAADEAGKKRMSQEIKNRITIVQRGVGGIAKGKTVTYPLSDGKRIEKVTEVVAGTDSVVRALSFQHR